jgi:hypothetical protein
MRLLLVATLLLFSSQAFAETHAAIVYVQGTVKIIRSNGQELNALLGAEVAESDTLVTEDASQVRVRLYDLSLVRLGASSRAQISKLSFDGSEKKTVSVKLVVGRLWASVSKLLSNDSTFEVQTGSAVAGVRGTEFAVLLRGADSEVTTAEGSVNVRAADGSERLIGAGFAATVGANGFRDVRQVSAEAITALRDESRGHGGGGAHHEANAGAIEARLERAMDNARGRMDGGDRGGDDRRGADRGDRGDRPRIGGEQGVIENRQRGRDVFETINQHAAATRLRAVIDVKE